MRDDFVHLIAYGAIVLVLIFWPSFEHAAACASYGCLFVLSAITLASTLLKKRAPKEPEATSTKDLREGLPYWPLANS